MRKLQSTNSGNFMDVFEGSMASTTQRGSDGQSFGRIFTVLLFVLFIAVLLLAIMAGTMVYKALSTMSTAASETRVALSLVANSVRGDDSYDAVGVGTGPEGDSLVLTETFPSGTFETRIYLYKGHIMQEYSVAGTEYAPDRATPIVASGAFSFEYADGLLTLTTDQGSADIALRTLRGGE